MKTHDMQIRKLLIFLPLTAVFALACGALYGLLLIQSNPRSVEFYEIGPLAIPYRRADSAQQPPDYRSQPPHHRARPDRQMRLDSEPAQPDNSSSITEHPIDSP